jgi:hypothetical protein
MRAVEIAGEKAALTQSRDARWRRRAAALHGDARSVNHKNVALG